MIDTLPFRFGATSYVIPGDLAENAQHLAANNLSLDMQLVLFDLNPAESNLPDAAMIERLIAIGETHDLTYTVHLPINLRMLSNGNIDNEGLATTRRVIEATLPLNPRGYTAHVQGRTMDGFLRYDDPDWTMQAIRTVERVLDWLPDPALLALENIETYAPEALLPIFEALPVSRTLDIGHLWKLGIDALPVMDDWLPHTSIIHLHGYDAPLHRDHLPLTVQPPEQLHAVLAALQSFTGVLTLEVFEDDFFASRDVFMQAWQSL